MRGNEPFLKNNEILIKMIFCLFPYTGRTFYREDGKNDQSVLSWSEQILFWGSAGKGSKYAEIAKLRNGIGMISKVLL
jgi:hypothetical protein